MILVTINFGSDNSGRNILLPFTSVDEINSFLESTYGLSKDCYYISSEGKLITRDEQFTDNGHFQIFPKLFGGKGGFGSMLRAIGAQIEKTTNREACRDLSGRRLRDINEEQRLKSWISQQAEREREMEERKKKKLEKLSSEPKHEFKDEEYEVARSVLSEQLSDAVEQGFLASQCKSKRPALEDTIKKKKKKKFLMCSDEEFSSSEGSDYDSSDQKTTGATDKKQSGLQNHSEELKSNKLEPHNCNNTDRETNGKSKVDATEKLKSEVLERSNPDILKLNKDGETKTNE